jgi:antitoxin CptB|tara:strand:- start:473 stop:733 length:261 start_codon:yes stop_codon:yes gene_type:complete
MAKNLFKKKILHRAKYRGIKELDIIFYKFLLEYEDKITDDELYELEGILDLPDSELLDILYKKTSIPSNLKDGILKKILEKCYAED